MDFLTRGKLVIAGAAGIIGSNMAKSYRHLCELRDEVIAMGFFQR